MSRFCCAKLSSLAEPAALQRRLQMQSIARHMLLDRIDRTDVVHEHYAAATLRHAPGLSSKRENAETAPGLANRNGVLQEHHVGSANHAAPVMAVLPCDARQI